MVATTINGNWCIRGFGEQRPARAQVKFTVHLMLIQQQLFYYRRNKEHSSSMPFEEFPHIKKKYWGR